MGDQQAQGDAGVVGQHGAGGGVAVQVEIGLHGAGDLGLGRRTGLGGAAVGLGGGAGLAGFLARQITLVGRDLAARVDRDEHLAALGLGGLFVLVSVEILAHVEHLDRLPALSEITVAKRGDGLVLVGPEEVGVVEITVLAEQVGDDPARIGGQIEDCDLGGDRLTAEQPRLEVRAGRRVLLRVIVEGEPIALLGLGRHGQVADRRHVDGLLAVERADARQKVAEREDAADLHVGEVEGLADLVGRAAFLLDQPGEGHPLRDLVGVEPGEVLDQRGFERGGVVAGLHDRAGQRAVIDAIGQDEAVGGPAPRARDDLGLVGRAALIGPNDQGNDHAALANRAEDVGDVRGLLAVAHVGGRNAKLVLSEMCEFHGSLLLWGWNRLRPIF